MSKRPSALSPSLRSGTRLRCEQLEDRDVPSAGMLDPTFNPSGSPPGTLVSTMGSSISAIAVQTDGKIVAAGSHYYRLHNGSWGTQFTVGRFNPNGTLDTTFNGTGMEYISFNKNGGYDSATSVAIQPDGKIVAAGGSNGSQAFAVVRFNTNGLLDKTFDRDGIVLTDVSSGADAAYGVVIQSDGKIVAAGQSNNRTAVVRYTSTGSLDSTFGSGGVAVTPLVNAAYAVALQNGQVVTAGYAGSAAGDQFALVRFNTNGSLDSTFGSGGVAITPPRSTAGDTAHALAVQPDGSLVVGGEVRTWLTDGSGGVSTAFTVARYDANGSLDTSFNGTGFVILSQPVQTSVSLGVLYQSLTGSIIATGYDDNGFVATRLTSAGALDPTFGNGGVTETMFGDATIGAPFGGASALQPDGKLVVAGTARKSGIPFGNVWGIARYLADDSGGGGGGAAMMAATKSETSGRKSLPSPALEGSMALFGRFYFDPTSDRVTERVFANN